MTDRRRDEALALAWTVLLVLAFAAGYLVACWRGGVL